MDFEEWPCQLQEPFEFRHSQKSRKLIKGEIDDLKSKGMLEEGFEEGVSNVFIRPQTQW